MKKPFHADSTTMLGALLAAAGLYMGLRLEGIQFADVVQLAAALVVVCGTAGAVLISTPLVQTREALTLLPSMLRHRVDHPLRLIEEILSLSRMSRTRGLPQMHAEVELIADPFLRKGMRLAVDSVGTEAIARVLDADVQGFRLKAELAALFYETAAGYAPTLGMAGAAIGLIHVLKHLGNLEIVGAGVAAAFVAIVYGVLLANLVLLPVASKIRTRAEAHILACLLMRDGVLAICSGLNPMIIRLKLESLAQLPHTDARSSAIRAVAA